MPSIAHWIRQKLRTVSGDGEGAPFKVLKWEQALLDQFSTSSGDIPLSIPRGNGKSAFVAAIATAAIDPKGPLFRRNTEIDVVASSLQQGRIIFEDVLMFMRQRYGDDFPSDRNLWRIADTINHAMLTHRPSNTKFRCLGSDPRRAHGLRPYLLICDEGAQWPPSSSDKMYSALRTGLGKVKGSRMIAIGTRPADSNHWFSRMLDKPNAIIYAAPKNADIFDPKTWREANPSWRALPSLRERIREEAKDAKADRTLQPQFKALRLNMGVSEVEEQVVLEAETWERIQGDVPRRGPCAWGVDLGTTASASAIASYWPMSGRLEVLAAFPAEPDLETRSTQDSVGSVYILAHNEGHLILTPGLTSDPKMLLREALNEWGRPTTISADRWREGELREGLRDAGIPVCNLMLRGQGFKDGAADLRAFVKACLDGRVTPHENILLTHGMSQARCVTDPAGNRKLATGLQGGRKSKTRDDVVAASILAVAAPQSAGERRSGGKRYLGAIR